MTRARASFGAKDTDYLVATLTIPQLRQEIRNAGIRQHKADAFRGTAFAMTEDDWPWGDWADACRLTIDILRARQPKSLPNHGMGMTAREVIGR